MKKSIGKRLVSGLTSAMLAVTYALPNAVPLGNRILADAAENLGNKDPVSDVTLLVGKTPTSPTGDAYSEFSTVADAIAQYEKDYVLGIASQFSVFLKEDFTAKQADTEGRMALGGSASMTSWGNPYEVAKGDYITYVPLNELISNSEFASIIWEGAPGKELAELQTSGLYYYDDTKKAYVRGYDPEKTTKRIAVQQQSGVDYVKSKYSDSKNLFYSTTDKLINFDDAFGTLQERSERLAKKSSDFEDPVYDVNETESLTYFAQSDAADYSTVSGTFKKMDAKGVATFKCKKTSGKVVYLDIDSDTWTELAKCRVFRFEDVPEDSYIVINIAGNEQYVNSLDPDNDRYTFINGHSISKGAYTVLDEDGSPTDIDLDGVTVTFEQGGDWANENYGIISNISGADDKVQAFKDAFVDPDTGEMLKSWEWYRGRITGWHNNYPEVDRLLYNFYEAETLSLGVNAIQGTILAPNANVYDKADNPNFGRNGHLSGALIAKSFKGNMEFGYRPFTGPISLLGANVGYSANLMKNDNLGLAVQGAEFGLFKGADTTPSASFSSGTDGTISITFGDEIPDTAGTINTEYTLKETSAPEGYSLSDEKFFFDVEQTFKKANEFEDFPDGVTSDGDELLPESAKITAYNIGDVKSGEGEEHTINYAYAFDTFGQIIKRLLSSIRMRLLRAHSFMTL